MMKKMQTTLLLMAWLCLFNSCKSDEVEAIIEEEATIAGNYTGSWSSVNPQSTYDGLAISARVTETSNPNIFDGEFFFTSSYVSCCNSGVNDGTLRFVVDGNNITEFIYNDILPNCNGTFTGTGTINDNGSIRIEFTGFDCEGDHTDGVLIFN